MFSFPRLGRCAVDLAVGVNEPARTPQLVCLVAVGLVRVVLGFQGVEDGTTGIALISPSAWVVADGALPLDKAVCEERAV